MSEAAFEISMPCDACGVPVRYGQRACSACGFRVTAETKRALERRVAGASPELRRMKDRLGATSIALVFLAIAHVVFGALYYYVRSNTDIPHARLDLGTNIVLAALMVACAVATSRWPVPSLLALTIAWVLIQLATMEPSILDQLGLGFEIARIAGGKVITFVLLMRACIVALDAARVRRRFAVDAGPHVPLPSARVIER